MDTLTQPFSWLAVIDRPAFCVKGGTIVAVNSAAEHWLFQIGTDIRQIVTEHYEQYCSFENGSLFLPIMADGIIRNANVTRIRDYDIFLLDNDTDDAQLRTLALAAKQLRMPLSNLMLVADKLLTNLNAENVTAQQQANLMNQGLFQLQRIISNMSDSGPCQVQDFKRMETINLTALFDEVMEKIRSTVENQTHELRYTSPGETIFGFANSEKIERAVYNLLSNALKFSPAGSCIDAALTKNGDRLSFTVCNPNTGSLEDSNFWNRYRREPTIEESRFGLGLGMTLIQAAATAHKGTVLVDHPSPYKTRVTMTITILKDDSGNIHSPIMRIGDYAGGRDKGLLELSEILPAAAYSNTN